jgi:mono/diheme cytochrome c family protein
MRSLRGSAGAIIALGCVLSCVPTISAEDAASTQDKAKVEAGENVYNIYCQVCHGDALVSTGQIFDLHRLTTNAGWSEELPNSA